MPSVRAMVTIAEQIAIINTTIALPRFTRILNTSKQCLRSLTIATVEEKIP